MRMKLSYSTPLLGAVRIINHSNGIETALAAQLVTNGMGLAARTSAFLHSVGYGRLPAGGGHVGERIEIRRVVIG
jgi:hypothetical protein